MREKERYELLEEQRGSSPRVAFLNTLTGMILAGTLMFTGARMKGCAEASVAHTTPTCEQLEKIFGVRPGEKSCEELMQMHATVSRAYDGRSPFSVLGRD